MAAWVPFDGSGEVAGRPIRPIRALEPAGDRGDATQAGEKLFTRATAEKRKRLLTSTGLVQQWMALTLRTRFRPTEFRRPRRVLRSMPSLRVRPQLPRITKLSDRRSAANDYRIQDRRDRRSSCSLRRTLLGIIFPSPKPFGGWQRQQNDCCYQATKHLQPKGGGFEHGIASQIGNRTRQRKKRQSKYNQESPSCPIVPSKNEIGDRVWNTKY